jgi:hypothetical protein
MKPTVHTNIGSIYLRVSFYSAVVSQNL